MDISQKLEVTAIFSDLAKKGGKELKAKNQRKLAGKLRGRVGGRGEEAIEGRVPLSEPTVGRLPCLSSSVIKNPWEGRGDCLILSVGEVREEPVKGTDYTTNMNKERENRSAKFLNLGSANYRPSVDCGYEILAATQAHSSTRCSTAAFPPQGRAERLTGVAWPATPKMLHIQPATDKGCQP